MRGKPVSKVVLMLLLASVMTSALIIQPVESEPGTIRIRDDGSVDPLTAPIQRDGNVYTLTADINDCLILIERDNIVVDGDGHKLQGVCAGFSLLAGSNYVTIRNTWISTQGTGIFTEVVSHTTIVQNVITSCGFAGIYLHFLTSDSLIHSNIIEDCQVGILLNATAGNNRIFHNDFINNVWQVWPGFSSAIWDDGYPSGGNYWSDYAGSDADHDGIGDTPYVIDALNRDRYPLMDPWIKPPPPNKPPAARFTYNPATPKVGQSVAFDASSSYDPDGTIVLYSWSFGDGSTKTGKRVTHSYSNAGNFKVKLLIKDNDGDSSSTSKTVTTVKPAANKNILKISARYYDIIAQSTGWTQSGSFYYLDYYPDGTRLPRSKRTGGGYTTVDDGDIYPSECVDFVRVLSNTRHVLTKNWLRGPKVMTSANIELGTVIATFSYDSALGRYKYDWGHVAVFAGFRYSGGRRIGFRLFDQNWRKDGGLGVVGKHNLYTSGSSYVSDADNYYVVTLKGITFRSSCPVDLAVTDPDGLLINKGFSEIPDAMYVQEDFDEDGSPEDQIYIPEQKIGEYSITVIAEPEADPTATYTLEVSAEDATLLLAEDVPISEIPTDPYRLDSTTFDTSPLTTLIVGEPQYIDPPDSLFVSPKTPFDLAAEDNLGGSGVLSTCYRIRCDTYETDWLSYTEPFNLTGLVDGAYHIDYNSTDYAGNVEPTNTESVILDSIAPEIVVLNPPSGWALQDSVAFFGSIVDVGSGVLSTSFSISEADGGEGIPMGFEDLPASYDPNTGEWSFFFNTLLVPDGYYAFHVEAEDRLGNEASTTVPYSIRNWAVIELLPSSEDNKAGRTMPVKFALRVAAEVDPDEPFVYNEELRIEIFATDDPGNVLQESYYGDTATDYRISSVLYITNFKTLGTPMQYTVVVCRDTFDVGSFEFRTVK